MKKFKRISTILFLTLVFTAGCSNNNKEESNKNTAKTNNEVATIVSQQTNEDKIYLPSKSDSIFNFKTPSDPARFSNVIVEGTVTNAESKLSDLGEGTVQVFTLVTVKVSKDFRNVLQEGEEVYFLEFGGTSTIGELKLPEKDFIDYTDYSPDKIVVSLYDGVENSKVGQNVLFFGYQMDGDQHGLNLGKPYYTTVGAQQGRYLLDKETNEYIRSDVAQSMDKNNAKLRSFIDPNMIEGVENVPNDDDRLRKIEKDTPIEALDLNNEIELNRQKAEQKN